MDFLINFFTYVICFIGALSVIVFIHEFGHYYVARLCGVGIQTFSIGFGKEIFGWFDKRGTRWKLCWLPLGGYVKFEGDANAASFPKAENASTSPTSFHGKPLWQRALVVAAGPGANFILATLLFGLVFFVQGERVDDPVVGKIIAGGAADRAGIKPNDIIKQINGKTIVSFRDLQKTVFDRAGDTLVIELERDGKLLEVTAVPVVEEIDDGLGGKARVGRLGIHANEDPARSRNRDHTVISALAKGADHTWFVARTTLRYIGKIFTGRESADQIRGPAGIAQIAGVTAFSGFWPFLELIAALSVSIGLINLFPVPMLDGGHLVYYGIEALRGKPLGQAAQEWGFRIGLSMVMMLLVVATWNDLVRMLGG